MYKGKIYAGQALLIQKIELQHKNYLLGLVRCSLRCLDIPKHFCLLSPNIPSIALSGVKNCLFSGSWEQKVTFSGLVIIKYKKDLQIFLLKISPQLLDHLRPGHLEKNSTCEIQPQREECKPVLPFWCR